MSLFEVLLYRLLYLNEQNDFNNYSSFLFRDLKILLLCACSIIVLMVCIPLRCGKLNFNNNVCLLLLIC